jgi:hypothetical protein
MFMILWTVIILGLLVDNVNDTDTATWKQSALASRYHVYGWSEVEPLISAPPWGVGLVLSDANPAGWTGLKEPGSLARKRNGEAAAGQVAGRRLISYPRQP